MREIANRWKNILVPWSTVYFLTTGLYEVQFRPISLVSYIHNVTCLNLLHVPNKPHCPGVGFWLIHETLLNAYVLSDVQYDICCELWIMRAKEKTADAYWRKCPGIFWRRPWKPTERGHTTRSPDWDLRHVLPNYKVMLTDVPWH